MEGEKKRRDGERFEKNSCVRAVEISYRKREPTALCIVVVVCGTLKLTQEGIQNEIFKSRQFMHHRTAVGHDEVHRATNGYVIHTVETVALYTMGGIGEYMPYLMPV